MAVYQADGTIFSNDAPDGIAIGGYKKSKIFLCWLELMIFKDQQIYKKAVVNF